jgi:acetyl esterase/lipase
MDWAVKHRVRDNRKRDVAEAREAMRSRISFRKPADVTITAAGIEGVAGEWLEKSTTNGLTLIYLHGGSYYTCSAETHRPITAAFAQQGFRVFAADYRLAPEHPFPAAVDDSVAVYRGLVASGAAPDKIVVAGDSAGGALALALMISARDAGEPLPAACALFSPHVDLTASRETVAPNSKRAALFESPGISPVAVRYLAGADPRHPLASPLFADLSNLPPILIHAGRDEILADDSIRLIDRARAAGVQVESKIWPVVPHGWQMAQRRVPEARQSVREAGSFLLSAATAYGRPYFVESAQTRGS